jgi:hypothetical protein
MKRLLLFGLGALSVACSHYGASKSPQLFTFSPELLALSQAEQQRTPASLSVTEVERKSPRRVYFSALFYQYLTLAAQLEKKSAVEVCPQFHHDKLEVQESFVPSVSSLYTPEMIFTSQFSLQDYFATIESEISLLCEEGLSDNYYKFDNLITHFAPREDFHRRPDSMPALLKIPVFANYYLLKMLKAPQAGPYVHPYEKEIISLGRTYWFERYVARAQVERAELMRKQSMRAYFK